MLDPDSLYEELLDGLIKGEFPQSRPLLAHYTSLQVIESILKNEEIWFSNPLSMNDIQEVRFVINEGLYKVINSKEIESSLNNSEKHEYFKSEFQHLYDKLDTTDIIDTYIFCLSEHKSDDEDGILAMWRGYGGNGSGAAIVFDTSEMNVVEGSPLIIDKITYETNDVRLSKIDSVIAKFAKIIEQNNISSEDDLNVAAYLLFNSIFIYSLFSKHRGFEEECEWRVVYMRERDSERKFDNMLSYYNNNSSLDLKLKYKLQTHDTKIDRIVSKIILGPNHSHPLIKNAALRMLDCIGRGDLKSKLRTSQIPYRIK